MKNINNEASENETKSTRKEPIPIFAILFVIGIIAVFLYFIVLLGASSLSIAVSLIKAVISLVSGIFSAVAGIFS